MYMSKHLAEATKAQQEQAFKLADELGSATIHFATFLLERWTMNEEAKGTSETAYGILLVANVTDMKSGDEGGEYSTRGMSAGFPELATMSLFEAAQEGNFEDGVIRTTLQRILQGKVTADDLIQTIKNNKYETVDNSHDDDSDRYEYSDE